MEDFWRLLTWMNRGKQRRLVFLELEESPLFPQEIRRRANNKITEGKHIALPEVSRHLRDFVQRDLVWCVDEDLPWGRGYVLTKAGIELRKKMLED